MFILEKVVAGSTYTCGTLESFQVDGFVINLVHLIYLAIQVAVPIILIIFATLDLGKAVMAQKEDEIKKGQQMFVKRLITAVIVFLVFFVVKTVIGLVAQDESVTSCMSCFINAEVDENACKG